MLFLGERGEVQKHPVSFQLRQQLHLSVIGQFLRELEEDDFPLFLVSNGTAPEMNIGFHLVAVFQEFDGMLDLKVEVMIIGIRAEAYFFNDLFSLLRF